MPRTEEHPMRKFVSPEYKSKCMEWALEATRNNPKRSSDLVIATADRFYDYVYGEK